MNKKILIILLNLFCITNLLAKNMTFKINLGNAVVSGVIPRDTSKDVPIILYDDELDICNRDILEIKSDKYGSIELMRIVWDFKRFFRKSTGGLVFTISIRNNEKYGYDYKSYFYSLQKNTTKQIKEFELKGFTNHDVSIEEEFKEFDIDGHKWFSFNTTSRSNITKGVYLRTMVNDNILLRFNIIKFDERKESKRKKEVSHPKAEAIAKTIIESLKLEYPESGKACEQSKN